MLLYGFDTFGFRPEPPARGRFEAGELALLRCSPRGEARTTFAATSTGFRWAKHYRPTADHEWQPVVAGVVHRR